ncbi:uncharacterized protein ColSpa_11247 [Colletotrichum spaethianum]|uniref:Uncharacterized protein n=1 Tax=Colletotrichum spaethianum TaxID=700344 RepID=A0AA37PEZ0_9PEZI|nr:uncharacterized protein ColSpa_11247 [Colletotrichum spaethianum]GKT51066.1 hypothetical protein ColSpa_11247 [Colletotrichum spaethianum]
MPAKSIDLIWTTNTHGTPALDPGSASGIHLLTSSSEVLDLRPLHQAAYDALAPSALFLHIEVGLPVQQGSTTFTAVNSKLDTMSERKQAQIETVTLDLKDWGSIRTVLWASQVSILVFGVDHDDAGQMLKPAVCGV